MRDRINLLPLEIKQKRKAAKRNTIIFSGVAAYIGVIIIFFIAISIFTNSINKDLEIVKQKRTILRAKISQYSLFEKREKELDGRKELVRTAKEGEIQWSRIMYKLSLLLPPQVWLSNFKVDEQNLAISGNSLDLQGVSGSILQMLNLEELTDRVTLKDINKDKDTQTMIFNINTALREEEEPKKKSTTQKGSSK